MVGSTHHPISSHAVIKSQYQALVHALVLALYMYYITHEHVHCVSKTRGGWMELIRNHVQALINKVCFVNKLQC